MKRIIVLIFIMIVTLTSTVSAGEFSDVSVDVNGIEVEFENPPVIRESRTMAPLRAVFESLGMVVEWNGKDRSITGKAHNVDVWLQIDNKTAIVNGNEVELDVAAFIIEGRAYVPVRFLGESTGCSVGWDEPTRMVDIRLPNPELEMLKGKVQIKSSELLFTLFAFMNFTGYDDENASNMHEVRIAVREELDAMNLELKDNDFYLTAGVPSYRYISAARNMNDGLTDFDFEYEYNGAKYLKNNLPEALKEFYVEAHIHELYEKYYEKIDDEFLQYEEVIEPLYNMLTFLRFDIESSPEFYIQVNLLEAYWRGNGLSARVSETELSKSIITGPNRDGPNTVNILHEYAHLFVNEVTRNNYDVIKETDYLYDAMVVGSKADNSSYHSWMANVNESFVRALSAYFAYDEDKAYVRVDRETSNGFVMTRYVLDKFIGEYDGYQGSFEEFVVEVIESFASENE